MRNVIIIGSGPAGLTAALYAARANLNPLVIEGLESGGQLMLTTAVENFPGFRDGIMGPELMAEMRAQAARFGAEIMAGDVTSVELGTPPFVIRVGEQTHETQSLIISTGASARLLGLPSERALMGMACLRARPATATSSAASPSPWSAAATRPWRRPSSSPSSPRR